MFKKRIIALVPNEFLSCAGRKVTKLTGTIGKKVMIITKTEEPTIRIIVDVATSPLSTFPVSRLEVLNPFFSHFSENFNFN